MAVPYTTFAMGIGMTDGDWQLTKAALISAGESATTTNKIASCTTSIGTFYIEVAFDDQATADRVAAAADVA